MRIDENKTVIPPQIGKDELNIAEWPNGLLSKRPSKEQKTRVFEDTIGNVKRTVTITGSDKYGLPGYREDEILFGLLNLTREKNGLKDRTVSFKRSELIRTLGWPDRGKSWSDLDQSLNVIAGTFFVYENAWYEKGSTKKKFVNKKFHMLDHVELLSEAANGAEYFVTWGNAIFESFQCGSIRSIDVEFWRELKSPVAKRLFRFLGKQFWNTDTVAYDIVVLGVHKLGMREGIDVGEIKRGLAPGIRELEEKRFLVPLPPRQRFRKRSVGSHEIVFTKGASLETRDGKAIPNSQLQKLTSRGVAKARAQELVAQKPETEIDAALKDFDERSGRGYFAKAKSNPGGWLYKRIRDGVAKQSSVGAKAVLPMSTTVEQERNERAREEQEAKNLRKQDDAVAAYLASLPPDERKAAIERAWELASSKEQAFRCGDSRAAGAMSAHVLRRAILPLTSKAAASDSVKELAA